MFSRILFPVDFSENSQRIVPYVLEMAQKFKASVDIIFVAQDLDHLGLMYVPYPSIADMNTEIQKGAATIMEEFTQQYLSKISDLKTAILTGDPAEQIIRYAEENDMKLIIMGTHGRKGMDRVIFGSVAENVVRHSPIPVVTVNPYRSMVERNSRRRLCEVR